MAKPPLSTTSSTHHPDTESVVHGLEEKVGTLADNISRLTNAIEERKGDCCDELQDELKQLVESSREQGAHVEKLSEELRKFSASLKTLSGMDDLDKTLGNGFYEVVATLRAELAPLRMLLIPTVETRQPLEGDNEAALEGLIESVRVGSWGQISLLPAPAVAVPIIGHVVDDRVPDLDPPAWAVGYLK